MSRILLGRTVAAALASTLFVATSLAARAEAPPNDEPSGATELAPLPFGETLDASGATWSPNDFDVGIPEAPSVWYRLTAADDAPVFLDLAGGATPWGVIVFDGDPTAGGVPFFGNQDNISLAPTPGTTYYFMVVALGSPELLTVSADLLNDEPETAWDIASLPFTQKADISAASWTPVDPAYEVPPVPDVWYTLTAADERPILFDVSQSNGTLVVIAFDGPPDTGFPVTGGIGTATLEAPTPGTTYYVMVFVLEAPAPPEPTLLVFSADYVLPLHDEQDTAIPFGPTFHPPTVDVSAATPSPSDPFFRGELATVWYRYTAETDGAVALRATGDATSFLFVFAVPDEGIELSEADAVAFGYDEVLLRGELGRSYLVCVGFEALPSALAFSADPFALPAPPPNDELDAATAFDALPFSDALDAGGATPSPSDPGLTFLLPSVWYRFNSSVTGSITLDASDAASPTLITVLDAGLAPIAEGLGQLGLDVEAGQDYLIQVAFQGLPGALVFSVTAGELVAPPDHDEIGAADIGWELPRTTDFDVRGATANPSDPVQSGGRATVWYAMTAPFDGTFVFDTTGSDGTVDLALFEIDRPQDPFSVTRLHFIDYASGQIVWSGLSGKGYIIMAMPNEATHLVARLASVPPPNDDIADALPIDPAALPTTIIADTRGSVAGDDAAFVTSSVQASVWYRITPSAPTALAIDTNVGAALQLLIFRGYPTTDNPALSMGKTALLPLAAGETYYLGVITIFRGDLPLAFSLAPPAPNDEPGTATPIASLPFRASIANPGPTPGIADPTLPLTFVPVTYGTVWYTFTPDRDLQLGMGLSLAQSVAVLSGGPGAWELVGAKGPTVIGSVDSVPLEAGLTYAIMVTSGAGSAPFTSTLDLVEGPTAAARLSGTVTWGNFIAKSGRIEVTGNGTSRFVSLAIAADGRSGTYSVELPLGGSFAVRVRTSSCTNVAICGDLGFDFGTSPPTPIVTPGTTIAYTDELDVVSGAVLTRDFAPPADSGVALACGVVDTGERGPLAWVQGTWSVAGLSGQVTSAVASDGSYCVAAPVAHSAAFTVSSAPTQCTVETSTATAQVSITVPAGDETATLPPVSFADRDGSLDLTTGIAGEELYQFLVVECDGESCGDGCNAPAGATIEAASPTGIQSGQILLKEGDKHVRWTALSTPFIGSLFAPWLGGEGLGVDPDSLQEAFDAIGSVSIYEAETTASIAAGATTPVDLSTSAVGHLTANLDLPEHEGGFRVAMGLVAFSHAADPELVHTAIGQSLSLEGLETLIDANGSGVPPELEGVDTVVEPRPIELALSAGDDWRLRQVLGVTVQIPTVTLRTDDQGGEALEEFDLRVRVDALGVEDYGQLLIFPIDQFADTSPGGAIPVDVPIEPLAEGEVREMQFSLLPPTTVKLRVHLPPVPSGESAVGFMLFVDETATELPGNPLRVSAALELRLSNEPIDVIETGLTAGVHEGLAFGGDGSVGLDEALAIGSNLELFDTNIAVDAADGDEIDQTIGAPFTHELAPLPGETCAATVVFSGVASDDDGVVGILVDDVAVDFDADGRFAATIALAPGDNVVKLAAWDALDNWVVRTRHLQRKDPLIDTDGDQLGDCDESAIGTSPTDTDSDDDGWSDALDPDPLDPDVGASLVALLDTLRATLAGLPNGAFEGRFTAGRELRRRALVLEVEGASWCAERGLYPCAGFLVGRVLERSDGGSNDWVTDPAAAALVADQCEILLELLSLL